MKPLYTNDEYLFAKADDYLNLKCYCCEKIIKVQKKKIKHILKNNDEKRGKFCSTKCYYLYVNKTIPINCTHCNKMVYIRKSQMKKSKSGNHFCSQSCAITYRNIHKTTGNRRSKLEKYLESELIKLYPNLEIHFNRKDTINSELDIYIPSLKLTFELNGIFHYESIYGQDKLNQVQNNDNRKFQACLEYGIELCIIDTSQQKYFKEQTSQLYLNIIKNIINQKILCL